LQVFVRIQVINLLTNDDYSNNPVTSVTVELMNRVLGNVLHLISNNIGAENAPWMNTIACKYLFYLLLINLIQLYRTKFRFRIRMTWKSTNFHLVHLVY